MTGLSKDGFLIKRLEDIKQSLEEGMIGEFGSIDVSAESVSGQLIGVFSEPLSELWELCEDVYLSMYPSSANGVSLDNVVDLVGLRRLSSDKSTGTVQLRGQQGTNVISGSQVSVLNSGDKFNIVSDTTIDAANSVKVLISIGALQNNTLYTIIINGSNINFTSDADATEAEIISGLKSQADLSTEPVTAVDNGDNTLTISADDITVSFNCSVTANLLINEIDTNANVESDESGPIIGLAATISIINTPISGWDSVSNFSDVTVGRDTEEDVDLRTRRSQSIQIAGAGTIEAIRSRLLQVAGVTGATVLENITLTTDGNGLPPKSFSAIVSGGGDQDIADEIWLVKPAGIETYGSVSMPVVDSQGLNHTINFSRATEILIWVRITLTKSTEINYPTDGDTTIENEVLNIGSNYNIDNNVIAQEFFKAVFSVPGVESALIEIALDNAGSPGTYQTTNIAIASDEIAIFDSARVSII